jgi:hypothetical protein
MPRNKERGVNPRVVVWVYQFERAHGDRGRERGCVAMANLRREERG